jgi:hypothetical protein
MVGAKETVEAQHFCLLGDTQLLSICRPQLRLDEDAKLHV